MALRDQGGVSESYLILWEVECSNSNPGHCDSLAVFKIQPQIIRLSDYQTV